MTAAMGIDVCEGLRRDPLRESATEGAMEDTMDCRIDRVEPSRLDPARDSARTAGEMGVLVRSATPFCAEFGREWPGVGAGEVDEDSRTRLRCWYAEGGPEDSDM